MKRFGWLIAILLFGFGVPGVIRFVSHSQTIDSTFAVNQTSEDVTYNRIVSLLPSTTEVLYALNLGDKVVGVTRYCKYPTDAQQKPSVGGILDVNMEMVYGLKPDLIILPIEETTRIAQFNGMGIKTLVVDTKSVKGILDSIRVIGEELNRSKEALDLVRDIQEKIESIQSITANLVKPRVLITYLRPLGEGGIREVYIAGNHTYFNDLITVLGAENAYQGPELITSPILSPEGILRMNPDVIIEVMSWLDTTRFTVEDAMKDWDMLSDLPAYKNKKIFILSQAYIGIPGPRLTQTLDDLLHCIHPDVALPNNE